ncbi:type II toxin-antitoxin system RelE/ParE family toxin [Phyllobacterium bourgognense]|uniref:Toxin ParE1/3/4 n=1 Tax=Phyllobacterium bourgognense TaxID=314236 RepID=A0A368YE33_9HYPH|nr:type II toxin-antitoxin system RelE/ParE family toxin [Phyllobacterium bourgognense]RCW78501.1 toxin ParE1/3/4 [Phyllobacterium bourgognense]
MKLVWAQFALSDRDDIFTYTQAENPRGATRVDEQIVLAVRRVLDVPESGRPGRFGQRRELIIPHTPYVAAYAVTADTARILRILHGAQIWPDEIAIK